MQCSICKTEIPEEPNGWSGGHNASPVANGRCCSPCNQMLVIPARMEMLMGLDTPGEKSNG